MTNTRPQHPGTTIVEDILKPLGMSMSQIAMELHVPAARISEICRGRRSISADTALRLSRWLGASPDFWLGLQAQYDLECLSHQEAQNSAPRERFLPASEPS